MHPLVAIGLVLLAEIAWMVTILTMLIVLVRTRRRPQAHVSRAPQRAQMPGSDERAA
ncbi:hypothetical protein [Pseudarthrobacter oxydans]|uniref:hypothetical protein n=1 Tax=Pseudarthrobacter oxydans TaxID=1671 RepID=UPI0035EDB247|nr:hypothetical protein GCM10017547_32150 [Pseudarthrobacter oxydans]